MTIANAQIHVVYWGWNANPALAFLSEVIDDCLKRLPNSDYYKPLGQYGANPPHLVGSSIQPWDGPSPLDSTDIEKRLSQWFDDSVLPDPKAGDKNLLFVVFGPPGVILTLDGDASNAPPPKGFRGFHYWFNLELLPIPHTPAVYAAIPWSPFLSKLPSNAATPAEITTFSATAIDLFSPPLIHEVVEAVTDPLTNGEEIGDLCYTSVIRVGSWLVEKYFSDADARCVPAAWSAWTPIGGRIKESPAAYFRQPVVCDVFVHGMDDKLWQKSWVLGQGWWQNWQKVDPNNAADAGFTLLSGPAAASANPDHVQIFAYGTKGSSADPQVYSKVWTSAGSWSAWTPLGGRIKGSPAAYFRQPGICDVFVHGMDDKLWQKSWVLGQGWWQNWQKVDPNNGEDTHFKLLSAPSAASANPDHVQVFAYGTKGSSTDPQVYSKVWTAAGSWSAWEPLGGRIKGSPTAFFRQPGICDVFVHGMDDKLWQRSWVLGQGWLPHWHPVDPDPSKDATFTPLLPPPNPVAILISSPVAASMGPDQIQVFAYGTSNAQGDPQVGFEFWSW
jgi:hypothetical protein